MKTLKQILTYIIWALIALLFGFAHMRFVLGPKTDAKNALKFIYNIFYNWGLIHVGLVIGSIIAVIFILFDVFYFKKKLKNSKKAPIIRFSILFIISVFVGLMHYLLEKVIDVI